MKPKVINTLIAAIAICIVGAIDSVATSLYWQHISVTHHAAHFEADSWGISSFHWNDEYAQIPVADPVADSLIPPAESTPTPTPKHK